MREIVMCVECGMREAKRKTCGHPICVRKYRKQTARVRQKRSYYARKAERQSRVGYWGPDHSGRAAVVDSMREQLAAGVDELAAVIATAIKTDNRPATVLSIWRSAA